MVVSPLFSLLPLLLIVSTKIVGHYKAKIVKSKDHRNHIMKALSGCDVLVQKGSPCLSSEFSSIRQFIFLLSTYYVSMLGMPQEGSQCFNSHGIYSMASGGRQYTNLTCQG